MSLQISFNSVFVVRLGFVNYLFVAFLFIKFSANSIKMHESVRFFYVVAILVKKRAMQLPGSVL